MPDLLGPTPNFEPTFWQGFVQLQGIARFFYLLSHIPKAVREDRAQRRLIGQSRDPGYEFYNAVKAQPNLKVETASPVFDHAQGFIPQTVTELQENRFTRGRPNCASWSAP